MTTSNEEYLDAALRHQIGLRRYSSGLVNRIALLLQRADRDLTAQLRVRLAEFSGKPIDFTGTRWKLLLADVREARKVVMGQYKSLVRSELGDLSVLEGAREISLLESVIPIEVSFATVSAASLRAIVTSRPFQGRFLRDWFSTLETNDRKRLTSALQLGMVEGEPIDTIVRRVVGTRKQNYNDGILSVARRDATTIVRTAVNHVSNTARNSMWEANADIISARIWTATLDGRTSAICRSRDGKGSPITAGGELPPGIEPLVPINATLPAHMNERSIFAAYINGVGLIGKRPTVVDTRTRRRREIDFRAISKRTGKPIQQVRQEWADRVIGRVPADTTYQQFLSRQSASFQDEVLGVTKGRLFRRGKLPLDKFVDRRGNELTLSQLADTQPEAFTLAGLDPGDF